MRISDEILNGHLKKMVEEWERVQKYQNKHGRRSITPDGLGSNLWWLNQFAYLGEKFGIALVRDLLEARAAKKK